MTLRVIRADNPSPMTLDGTRTYLLGRDRPVVIDPGPDDPAHLSAIEQALDGVAPSAILLTHAHPDHAACAAPLAERTGAPIWLAEGAIGSSIPRARVRRWMVDGDAVECDAGPLRVVATPGHAPEHVAFWWAGEDADPGGALFVGDLLMGVGDTTLVAPPEGDLTAYLRSLDRVEALRCRVLYPSHGPAIEDPEGALRRYREHRLLRIREVAAAREARPDADPAELVRTVYGSELQPGLRAAAEGSVRAILEYLRTRESN